MKEKEKQGDYFGRVGERKQMRAMTNFEGANARFDDHFCKNEKLRERTCRMKEVEKRKVRSSIRELFGEDHLRCP